MTSPQRVAADEATATDLNGRDLDLGIVHDTISRARGQSSVPLNYDELSKLEAELCGYIAQLLPPAKKAVDKLWHGGTAWHQQISRLDGIERQVGQGLGTGVLSAHVQVQQLAKDCQWLIDHQGQQQ
ncbi:hypothetical protein YWIDRAFT_06593 [Streptomyces sp. SceaMP-e96]|uniref:DUF6415 family natural product biosynthesis protein n=1 Tax=unclassified Streptomyces TaxID=2593676 RepID=UPI000823CD21|nr:MULTISPECIES: DUF6415 family natural product biosynthesis protein [unclassified Streptomyces]MYT17001.1 hypothetical protein [Streptomyces sp. SID4951]SCK39151.1 hypothetical protein YWIDRAFT_06593 [Streptomyces sp. SceaMP-e96]